MQLTNFRAARCILLAGLALLPCLAQAQMPMQPPSRFEEDFDDESKAWTEIAVQIPALPKTEDLMPFYTGHTVGHVFSIDAKSVSVGADGVVRYTMVATSPAGARSISYEGIRCQSFEKKLYAFGHPNGNWSRSRRDKWEPIPRTVANMQHATLARDYFCRQLAVADDAAAIVERIRHHRPLYPFSGA